MKCIKTIEQLEKLKASIINKINRYDFHVLICGGSGCHAIGSQTLISAFKAAIKTAGLNDCVRVVETGCNGFCAKGPIIRILPDGTFYQQVKQNDIEEIINCHLKGKKPVERLCYRNRDDDKVVNIQDKIQFFKKQQTRVLKNKGLIDPLNILEYIARDGYLAVMKSYMKMSPQDIIDEIKISGLRGRGGGGFPTGIKWEFCASVKSSVKYVICNADEGDPGAFMDRSLLEADPHAVLEGMIIAARAIGARYGYIYCRAEYPLAVSRLSAAITQAREYGLLGKDILGSSFDFDIEIYKGAGAFVCGEETALMASIEGKRGTPRTRPPFPAVSGLWEKPTVLNNVETYANIAAIILEGGSVMSSIGTNASKGTKIFAVTGKVSNVGLVEVPMGTTIGEIVFDICGGIPNGKKFKAVQLGGPSGGCLPASHLNTPVDYDAVIKAGAIIGSGGMIVMDEDICMVDMARYFMEFCQDESCGNCVPCRVGTRRMFQILERICKGNGRYGDIELLENMARTIKDTALCGLGQTAPNPVLSAIRYFRHEFESHIHEKKCPAGVCASLVSSPCRNACPVNTDIPAYMALIRAGRFDDAYRVLIRTNPFPSICGRVCAQPCQSKCRRGQLDDPLAIKDLKRFVADNALRPCVQPIKTVREEKIAVVGAGPSGLTAAWELKKRGYHVVVYEKTTQAGGMLKWGIPAYRLPRSVLYEEIQQILDTGIELFTNTALGREISLTQLCGDFDAVFLSVGLQKSTLLGIPGENAKGVYGAIEFLEEINDGKKIDIGAHVAVVGAGNSAIDAARVAIRLGAESVTVYYRRTPQDMPALASEIKAARKEGVTFEFLCAPVKLLTKQGCVSGMELTRMELGAFDESGRKQPRPLTNALFTVSVETVISAIGQQSGLEGALGSFNIITSNGLVCVDGNQKTDNVRIWAGGDMVSGPSMVISAIAAGRQAANAIDATLRLDRGDGPWRVEKNDIEIPIEIDDEPIGHGQVPMFELAPEERRHSFEEVELGYNSEEAKQEACRCLRCDVKI